MVDVTNLKKNGQSQFVYHTEWWKYILGLVGHLPVWGSVGRLGEKKKASPLCSTLVQTEFYLASWG